VSGSSAVLLPFAPASVADARWRLSADLRYAGVSAVAIGDAALVVSELMSNAIRHARPLPGSLVEVTWALNGGSVEISVSDGGGATRPRPASPSLSSLGGRGLAIVEHLSCRWGVSMEDSRTTVWAVLPAPRRGGDGSRTTGTGADWAVMSGRARR
jgi:anti-sigma regulatory factor (Ser/Thr protein kinase)